MAEKKNRYGLSRRIPNDVKRKVRKRCLFGCVHCGSVIYQYEHFNPEFKDAQFHDENGITLLCATVHDKKTRGRISRAKIAEWNESPWSQSNDCVWEKIDDVQQLNNDPGILLGSVGFRNVENVITLKGKPIIQFLPPEVTGGPYRLNAEFNNMDGNQIARVEENEWIGSIKNWDIQVEGRSCQINNDKRDIALAWEYMDLSDRLTIGITKLKMNYRGFVIHIQPGAFKIATPNGLTLSIQSAMIGNAHTGINMDDDFCQIAPDGLLSATEFTIHRSDRYGYTILNNISFNTPYDLWTHFGNSRTNLKFNYICFNSGLRINRSGN
ncbi:MAG: hypothetical protein JXR76_00065 [Deltaproteobacteria bacterium]|nr:hypothetical protein [Deltaproteobacteria bacterium]